MDDSLVVLQKHCYYSLATEDNSLCSWTSSGSEPSPALAMPTSMPPTFQQKENVKKIE